MSKRYLLVRLISDTQLSREQFWDALCNSVRRYFGEIGLARVDPRVLRYDAAKGRAIVACMKDAVNDLQTALALISHIAELDVAPLVLGVSGTIRALERIRSR